MQNYFTQNFSNRAIAKFSAWIFLATAFAILAGCGSGQAIPTVLPVATPSGTGAAAVTPAATMQLLASSSQMPSAVGTVSTIDLTAIVLSATKETVSGKTVKFSTIPGETAFISDISASGVSDAKGMVTAKLYLGADRSNRTIVVTATSDSIIATNNIDVTGTTINVSGASALAFGATSTYTFSLKDSAEKPISGITLTITSASGNTLALTPATGITNSTGQVTAALTATKAGADTITATGAGATKTQALSVSSDAFAFNLPAAPVAPATTIDIPLNTVTPVSIIWKAAGVPVVGKLVSFASTRGAVVGSPSLSDAAGATPGITVSSASSGPAIISASGPGGTPAGTLSVVFVAKTASNVTAQAVPGTIQYTTGVASQTSNSATISAVVRDTLNNLVKDAGVDFNVYEDPSGGSLSAARAITDVSGTASVIYTAGNTSSAQNGVKIRATATDIAGVPIAAVSGTTALTVSGQSVLVRLGSDNLATSNSPTSPTYSKTYAAIVTDTAGNPIPGTQVHFALRPGQYAKGFWKLVSVNLNGILTLAWTQDKQVTCPNEDRNFNGFLDTPPAVVIPIDVENQVDPGVGGIPNGFGSLQPGMPAAVNATGTTDSKGVAVATVTYPKNHSNWTEIVLEARTGVTSNDPPAYTTFFLLGLSLDFADPDIIPPGQFSPWGVGASCGDLK